MNGRNECPVCQYDMADGDKSDYWTIDGHLCHECARKWREEEEQENAEE